jgi:hypothetical protein
VERTGTRPLLDTSGSGPLRQPDHFSQVLQHPRSERLVLRLPSSSAPPSTSARQALTPVRGGLSRLPSYFFHDRRIRDGTTSEAVEAVHRDRGRRGCALRRSLGRVEITAAQPVGPVLLRYRQRRNAGGREPRRCLRRVVQPVGSFAGCSPSVDRQHVEPSSRTDDSRLREAEQSGMGMAVRERSECPG